MSNWFSKDPFNQLRREIGRRKVFTSAESLSLYGIDATNLRANPHAVVLAESTEDVLSTVEYAIRNGYTVTPRGSGSGLSGGSVPVDGGIVLSCENMKNIQRLDPESRLAIVQPGVVTSRLQESVKKHKLFYPPDPSSCEISTIGGNVAENAGGLRCFKYGVTSHYVLGLEYVGSKPALEHSGIFSSSVIEPDVTGLLVGSEGTLGIITKVAVRLIPLPESTLTLSGYYESKEAALGNVENIVSKGLTPSVLEFIDGKALRASADYSGQHYPETAQSMLLVEIDGSRPDVEDCTPVIRDLLEEHALEVSVAFDEQTQENLWKLRRAISPSLIRLSSGKIHEDVAVPRSRLAEMVRLLDEISDECSLDFAIYGHAGDGNLHVVILYNANEPAESAKAKSAAESVFRSAIELDGTITGEHGIGYSKKEYLPWQLSSQILNLSMGIKNMFDPTGIFNPKKIF